MFKFRVDITVNGESTLGSAYSSLVDALSFTPEGDIEWEVPSKAFEYDKVVDPTTLSGVIREFAKMLREASTIEYKCSSCGGSNVMSSALVCMNTNDIYEHNFDGKAYCEDCDKIVNIDQLLVSREDIEQELH